ncbi:aspartic peptidase domain-containing protein [Mycena rebaudengoi]|nr:aspartic peptidase domain-containing protein [Mycena rebaudengoi]
MMLPNSSFLHLLLLSWNVDEPGASLSKFFNLPITKKLAARNLVKRGTQTAAFLRDPVSMESSGLNARGFLDGPLTDEVTQFTVSLAVGSPSKRFNLIVDTSSANTVFLADQFIATNTSIKTQDPVKVVYRDNSTFLGLRVFDRIMFDDIVLFNKSIAVGNISKLMASWDLAQDPCVGHVVCNLLGTELVLARGTVLNDLDNSVPAFTDALLCQRNITHPLFSLFLRPTLKEDEVNGVLTFGTTLFCAHTKSDRPKPGDIDATKPTGEVTFAIVNTLNASTQYWGIDQNVAYGARTILSSARAIIDSGTTLVLLESNSFRQYASLAGAVMDPATGLLRINRLQSVFFTINGKPFEFTANAQIWPRALNTLIGGSAKNVYLIIAELEPTNGEDIDIVLGVVFLQRFFTVYDYNNAQVGFANTAFTNATTN